MSTVFGKEGYRFIEINAVKTIFGAIILLPIFLLLELPIEELIGQSGSIFLIILLLLLSRLIGSLIIEIVQELVLLPVLRSTFSSARESNRDYLRLFPPHKMWKDVLFRKTREEIIILVCIFASLIILWMIFNTSVTPSFGVLVSNEGNSTNGRIYETLVADIGAGWVIGLANTLFLIFASPVVYLLYKALFDVYIDEKNSTKLLWKEKIKTWGIDVMILFFPLIVIPLLFPLIFFLLSYVIETDIKSQQIWFRLMCITFTIGYILLYFLSIRVYFSCKKGKRRNKNTVNHEKNLQNDFNSYYSLYYNLLNYRVRNIKLKSQLYLISAIHAFNLLSSDYVYDILEKTDQKQYSNSNSTAKTKQFNIPRYAIAVRIFRIIIDNVRENNFDTALGFFLSQFEEATVSIIEGSEDINLVIDFFEIDHSWDPEQLFLMLKALNVRGHNNSCFSKNIRDRVAKELNESSKRRTPEEFLGEINNMLYLGDSKKEIGRISSTILESVLRVASDSENEIKILVCVDFWRIFVKKRVL